MTRTGYAAADRKLEALELEERRLEPDLPRPRFRMRLRELACSRSIIFAFAGRSIYDHVMPARPVHEEN